MKAAGGATDGVFGSERLDADICPLMSCSSMLLLPRRSLSQGIDYMIGSDVLSIALTVLHIFTMSHVLIMTSTCVTRWKGSISLPCGTRVYYDSSLVELFLAVILPCLAGDRL